MSENIPGDEGLIEVEKDPNEIIHEMRQALREGKNISQFIKTPVDMNIIENPN